MKRVISLVLSILMILTALSGCSESNNNTAILGWDEGRKILGLDGGFGVNGSGVITYGSGSEGLMGVVNPNGLPGHTLSGVPAGTPGYGLDMMKLIDMANPDTPEARLKKELLEMYSLSSDGKLDDSKYHLGAKVYASMHGIESGSRTFLNGIYEGQGVSGVSDITEFTLAKYNTKVREAFNLPNQTTTSSSGGVWFDARGMDGYPDGPFQIESGDPNGKEGRRSTLIGSRETASRSWDMLFFPDNLAWVNYDLQSAVSGYSALNLSSEQVVTFAVAKHNRGSWNRQAFGIPYEPANAQLSFSDYIDTSQPGYKEAEAHAGSQHGKDILSAYNQYKPPIVGTENRDTVAMGMLLLLKSGWYLAPVPDSELSDLNFLDRAQAKAVFDILWPDQAGSDVKSYIIANYQKNPWDVVGISKTDYEKIYGPWSRVYNSSFSWASIFKVESDSSAFYKNKMPNGSNPPTVHLWDMLAIGHAAGALTMGDYFMLKLLLEAGLPSDVNGVAVDPTNPQALYTSFQTSNSSSYDPRASRPNAGEMEKNFQTILDKLGISVPTELRYVVLFSTYKESGTPYYLGGMQKVVSQSSYGSNHDNDVPPVGEEHTSWVSLDGHNAFAWYYLLDKSEGETRAQYLARHDSKLAYLNGTLYADVNGNSYSPSTKDTDFRYAGRRLFDCASFVNVGRSLGNLSKSGATYWTGYPTASGLRDGLYYEAAAAVPYNGVSYNMQTKRVSGASSVADIRDGKTVVEGGLKPGDILASGGHTFLVLGVAKTGATLSSTLTMTDKDLTVNAGDLVVLEARSSNIINGIMVRVNGNNYYVVRPIAYDIDD